MVQTKRKQDKAGEDVPQAGNIGPVIRMQLDWMA